MPSFAWRVGALVLLLGVVALVEWRLRGPEATRWREYGFLLLTAILAGALGVAVDQVTVSIAPEYFDLAKGIEPGPWFRGRVAALGFQAGFVAGAIGAGVLLFANSLGGRPRLPYAALGKLAPFAAVAALVLAFPGALILREVPPFRQAEGIEELLTTERVRAFMTVWGAHMGLYLGALLGLIGVVVVVARRRLRAADTTPDPAP